MVASRVFTIALLAFSAFGFARGLIQPAKDDEPLHPKAPDRDLVAASRKRSLETRSSSFHFSNEAELIYAERSNVAGESNFAAKVHITSERRILVLEEFEHLLSDAECTSSSIRLAQIQQSNSKGFNDFHELENGHIITSHSGCNNEGGRQVYKVLSIETISVSTVSLDVISVGWNNTFSNINLELGYISDAHELRSHAKVRRDLQTRQVATPSSASFNFTRPPTLTVSSPPSATPSGNVQRFHLSHSVKNYYFDLGTPVRLGCVDCSTTGTLETNFANFDINEKGISGSTNITATGMGAHIDLFTGAANSFDFNVGIPFLGRAMALKIKDVAAVNLTVGLTLAGGLDFQGDLGLTYGFDMRVPDGAEIVLDIDNVHNSGIGSFADTSVTPIPFQSNKTIQSLEFWLALRPAVEFGISLEDNLIGGAGVYIDTPIVHANVTPVSNVDTNCKAITSSTADSKQLRNILTNPIRVDMRAGIDFGAYVNVHEFHVADSLYEPNLASYKLNPMCLNFDKNTKSYSTAEKAVQKANVGAHLRPSKVVLSALVASTLLFCSL